MNNGSVMCLFWSLIWFLCIRGLWEVQAFQDLLDEKVLRSVLSQSCGTSSFRLRLILDTSYGNVSAPRA